MATYRELIALLEEAKNELHLANKYFEMSEDDSFYYRYSCEHTEKARGILFAYEVLKGKHIYANESSVTRELNTVTNNYEFQKKPDNNPIILITLH